MKKIFFFAALFAAAGIADSRALSAATAPAGKPPAAPAYEFSLDNVAGGKIELSSYKGKVVFLDFWASWCPPCRASMPAVKKLHEKYSLNKDFAVIGINMENISVAKKHAEEHKPGYLNAVGDDVTARRYGVRGIPTFVIVDKKGDIVKRWVGFGENVYDEWAAAVDEALAWQPEKPKKIPPASPKKKKKSGTK